MVKGEHLRPLLGFVVVCFTAALILASGVTTPAALRHIVAEQRVLPVPAISDTLLGPTLEKVTGRPTHSSSVGTTAGAAADQRATVVLASFPGTSSSGLTTAVAHVGTGHHATHHAHHAHHAASHATGSQAAPAGTTPVTQPVTPPATPGAPTSPTIAADQSAHGWAGGSSTHAFTGWADQDSARRSHGRHHGHCTHTGHASSAHAARSSAAAGSSEQRTHAHHGWHSSGTTRASAATTSTGHGHSHGGSHWNSQWSSHGGSHGGRHSHHW
jgi:hypothetical protein